MDVQVGRHGELCIRISSSPLRPSRTAVASNYLATLPLYCVPRCRSSEPFVHLASAVPKRAVVLDKGLSTTVVHPPSFLLISIETIVLRKAKTLTASSYSCITLQFFLIRKKIHISYLSKSCLL